MNEKKYLKWYNKVGYGSGDIAGNVVYAFLSSFVMIYLNYNLEKNIIKKEPFGQLKINEVKKSDAKAWLIKLQQVDGRGYSTIHLE